MKRSLNDGSGYLSIDHTNSPGIDPRTVPAALQGKVLIARGGELLERDVQQCSHCQRSVVLEPARVRARGVCLKCMHYLCDECEALRIKTNGACVPFKAVLDAAAEIVSKYAGQPDHPDAVIDPLAIATEKAEEIKTAGPVANPAKTAL